MYVVEMTGGTWRLSMVSTVSDSSRLKVQLWSKVVVCSSKDCVTIVISVCSDMKSMKCTYWYVQVGCLARRFRSTRDERSRAESASTDWLEEQGEHDKICRGNRPTPPDSARALVVGCLLEFPAGALLLSLSLSLSPSLPGYPFLHHPLLACFWRLRVIELVISSLVRSRLHSLPKVNSSFSCRSRLKNRDEIYLHFMFRVSVNCCQETLTTASVLALPRNHCRERLLLFATY